MIDVSHLVKVFRSPVKEDGKFGVLKTLFSRKYSDKVAVNDVSFQIQNGESVAYIGANGAGKSTTIKMLTGVLVPTAGQINVENIDPHRDRMKNNRNIGVVFGQRTQLWWDLPAVESLLMLKDIYEIPEREYRNNMAEFDEVLQISPLLQTPVRKLSLGQRMRVDLAASLLHNPKIIYLDEPTIGLDIAVKVKIRSFLKRINQEKKTTIILTSHDLDDIRDICKRVIIIDQGVKIYDDTVENLSNSFAPKRSVKVTMNSICEIPQNAFVSQVQIQNIDDTTYKITFYKADYAAYDIIKIVSDYGEIIDFELEEPGLQSVIQDIYNGTLDVTSYGCKK